MICANCDLQNYCCRKVFVNLLTVPLNIIFIYCYVKGK